MERSKNTMKRSARVFLNDLNQSKAEELRAFLYLCHDVLQYFIDLFWSRGEMKASFADLETVHLAVDRFDITTRLAQALAKQAKEKSLEDVAALSGLRQMGQTKSQRR